MLEEKEKQYGRILNHGRIKGRIRGRDIRDSLQAPLLYLYNRRF